VVLTGHNEAYYSDYLGNPQEFISMVKYGFLYQGQRYSWQKNRRGTPSMDQPPTAFVVCLQNHDQIANSGRGWRCHRLTSPGLFRAMTALTLLGPNTPMLFQGQEFCSSAPFLYFADHNTELAPLVAEGRRKFLSQFPALALPEMQKGFADPVNPDTFQRCKLNPEERKQNVEATALHRDLLHLRRNDPVFHNPRPRGVDGAVLGLESLVLRFFGGEHGDRLLLLNLGRDLHLNPAPEPLLAPPEGAQWEILWSSEDPRYGGHDTPAPDTQDNWRIPGQAAVVLMPRPANLASR
jgi:maltooligosyltrehalose trehalohydrolase